MIIFPKYLLFLYRNGNESITHSKPCKNMKVIINFKGDVNSIFKLN